MSGFTEAVWQAGHNQANPGVDDPDAFIRFSRLIEKYPSVGQRLDLILEYIEELEGAKQNGEPTRKWQKGLDELLNGMLLSRSAYRRLNY